MIKESETWKNPEYSYFMPVKIAFGRGCRERLASKALVQKAKKPLFVAGEHLKRDGTVDELISRFERRPLVYFKKGENHGLCPWMKPTTNKSLAESECTGRNRAPRALPVGIYNQKISKSDIETIDVLVSFCRTEKPDLIITIGGGTILDTAKSAAILANNPGPVSDYVVTKRKVINSVGIPLVAIPTTSGTGSEVTPWATVWDTENKKKYSLSSPLMFPKMALVDSELTDNLPPEITASTGMDALSQAIEAYWSKNHNPVSDTLALKAIELILANLEGAVKRSNKKNREEMCLGSLFSGLAFSNTETTICHAVSYPMTAHFGVLHGQAVAITLPSFIKYSLPVLERERREKFLHALRVGNEEKAAQKITLLMKNIGLATKLSQLGIEKKDIELIVKEGFHPDRANNAPRIPTEEELKKILIKIF